MSYFYQLSYFPLTAKATCTQKGLTVHLLLLLSASWPPSAQETDRRGAGGREAAGQPADAAASAGSFPEDVEPAAAA